MYQYKYVFAQLIAFLDRNHFNYLVRKYAGDKYVKHFTCWNQLLTLMFGQLSNRESLRDLIIASSWSMHTTLSVRPDANGLQKSSSLTVILIFWI